MVGTDQACQFDISVVDADVVSFARCSMLAQRTKPAAKLVNTHLVCCFMLFFYYIPEFLVQSPFKGTVDLNMEIRSQIISNGFLQLF